MHIYALPIFAGDEVAGSINFGYGDPPRDSKTLKKLADRYNVDTAELRRQAESYESRPPFIIELAKKKLETSARIIGKIIHDKQVNDAQ